VSDACSVIRDLIKYTGPISIERFIDISLFYHKSGYYSQNVEIGVNGDFVTAPVISSMFGEIIALYICDRIVFHDMKSITLIECGAGNGTMLSDIITTLKKFKSINVLQILSKIVIVEISEKLKAIQANALIGFGIAIEWCKDISEVITNGHPIFIGNEFLDAIPIKQYVFLNESWHQRCVGIESGTGSFIFTHSASKVNLQMYLELIGLSNISHGDVIEVPNRGLSIFETICSIIKSNDGCGLFIDYGYDHYQVGSTIQAIKEHHVVDIFADVGLADISHMVQFPLFLKTATDLGIEANLFKQKDFLDIYCINERFRSATELIRNDIEKLSNLRLSIARLMDPDMMGTMFHAMMIE